MHVRAGAPQGRCGQWDEVIIWAKKCNDGASEGVGDTFTLGSRIRFVDKNNSTFP